MTEEIFRKEAVEHHQRRPDEEQGILRASPRWLTLSYRLVVLVLVAGLLFVSVARVNEYASGPAVIRAVGTLDLTAKTGGTVSSIEVVPGEHVVQDQVLLRFESATELSELERARHEFDVQLVRLLMDPKDNAAKQSLATLAAQKQLAAAKLEQREIRAPFDGVVSAVRTRRGERLEEGQTALVLVRPEGEFRVVAALPAHYLPILRPGMPMRLEVTGYPYAYQQVELEHVESQAVGPAELKRFLGPELGDTVSVNGPVVLVEGRIPKRDFVAEGRTYSYFDGMAAMAQARVDRAPILLTLAPWIRVILEKMYLST